MGKTDNTACVIEGNRHIGSDTGSVPGSRAVLPGDCPLDPPSFGEKVAFPKVKPYVGPLLIRPRYGDFHIMNQWIAIGAFAVVGVGIPVAMIGISALLRPSVPERDKRATYESGEVPTGGTRIRFNIQYYMVALLFVVFDIETVLIFPWAVIYEDALAATDLATALFPMLVFIGVLVVGLAWAWRNGAVEWVQSPRPEPNRQRAE